MDPVTEPRHRDLAVTRVLEKAKLSELVRSGRAREVREAHKLSLGDIGSALGVSAVSVLRWERGDNFPAGDHASAYLRLLEQLEEVTR